MYRNQFPLSLTLILILVILFVTSEDEDKVEVEAEKAEEFPAIEEEDISFPFPEFDYVESSKNVNY